MNSFSSSMLLLFALSFLITQSFADKVCFIYGPPVPFGTTSSFNGSISIGTNVTLTCLSDMTTMFYSICMPDGYWSEPNARCPRTCSSSGPMGPVGTYSSYNGTNTVGTNVTFTCMNDGTTMFYSKCLSSGKWSRASGHCSCSYPEFVGPPDTFGTFYNNYAIGSNISFTCATDLTSKFYSTCMYDGTWSPIFDFCPEPCFPDPMGPLDTTSSYCGDNRVGANVTFTCNSDNTIMFYSQCLPDGTWSMIDEACPNDGGPSPMIQAVPGMNVLSDVNPCMYFTSPNWPDNYENTNLVWTFDSHATTDCINPQIETVFDPVFNMIANKKCTKGDRLTIPYPNKKGSKNVCGSSAPVVPPTSFPSGSVLSYNFIAEKRGFDAGFKATVCLICDQPVPQ